MDRGLEVQYAVGRQVRSVEIREEATSPMTYQVVFEFTDGTCLAMHADFEVLRSADGLPTKESFLRCAKARPRVVFKS